MTLPQARRRQALIAGRIVKLSPMRHKLLTLLLLRGPNELVSAAEIIEVLWPDADAQPYGAGDCIHIFLMQLRRAGAIIEGQHGRGWRIPSYARQATLCEAA